MDTIYNGTGYTLWFNEWSGEYVNVYPTQQVINGRLPLNQIIYTEDLTEDSAGGVFEFYDNGNNNQVFFFDFFIAKDEEQNLGNGHAIFKEVPIILKVQVVIQGFYYRMKNGRRPMRLSWISM